MENEREKIVVNEECNENELENRKSLYEQKKLAINESIEKLEALSKSLRDACDKMNEFADSLHTVEKNTIPEVIGGIVHMKLSKKPVFDSTGYLIEALNTFQE